MTTQEQQTLLNFYREQQRYNHALSEFIKLIIDINESEPDNEDYHDPL